MPSRSRTDFLPARLLSATCSSARQARRGNFLTFRSDRAGDIYEQLHERGVITDFRADRLRIGFGVYQDEEDVDRLLDVLATL